jgi:hypothetical protein
VRILSTAVAADPVRIYNPERIWDALPHYYCDDVRDYR